MSFQNVSTDSYLGRPNFTHIAEDRIAALPEPARVIAKAVEDRERDILAIKDGKLAKIDALRAQRDDVAAEMRHYDAQIDRGIKADVTDAKLREKMGSRHAAIKREISTLQAEVSSPEHYLPYAHIVDHFRKDRQQYRFAEVAVKAPKGKTALALLEANNKDRQHQLAIARAAEIAPLTKAEARSAVVAELDNLCALGKPDVSPAYRMPKNLAGRRKQGRVKFPTQNVPTPGVNDGFAPVDRGIAFVAWLLRDQVIAAFDRLLDEHESPHALSKDGREGPIEVAKRALHALEYEEAALTRMAREEGAQVDYRPDISIPALLGIVPSDDTDDGDWLEGDTADSDAEE